MNQLTLFDDGPQLALASDPVTSKIAAKEFDQRRDKVKQAFLTALADLGGGPCTAREVAERAKEMGLHGEAESVRKRTVELERDRQIVLSGLKRCSVTGEAARCWRIC